MKNTKVINPMLLNSSSPILELDSVSAGYGAVPVIHDVDLRIIAGEVVALLGANGAGKTTTILTMAGEVRPRSGVVRWEGTPINTPLHRRARAGLRLITEERSIFMSLTVADNLRLGHRKIDECLNVFPELAPLMKRKAGLLSGGEQQMLAVARALGGGCRVLLADELSLGLAPLAVNRLLEALRAIADSGAAVVLVEQNLPRAMEVADRAYVMQRGRVVMEGTKAMIQARHSEVESLYLSMDPGEVAV